MFQIMLYTSVRCIFDVMLESFEHEASPEKIDKFARVLQVNKGSHLSESDQK
jgi:hypothetical protein